MISNKTILNATTALALLAAPAFAFAQGASTTGDARVGTQVQGNAPDGTPGNPPGTAVGRAVDRATGATTPNMAVDSMSMRGGMRASNLIGANVYNENNESIGEISDLMIPAGGGQPVAVISVGGFLGIGAKLVAMPFERLSHNAERERWVLRGATKESLQNLPAFNFEAAARRG